MTATTRDRPGQTTIYTIGHSNHPLNGLINMLQYHGIERVVDVRSHPRSRYVPHFNREALQASLQEEGIEYEYQGQSLGGRPSSDRLYRDGAADYQNMAQEKAYRDALAQVAEGSRTTATAIMCTEREPEKCHRSLLVAESLAQMGLQVVHIQPRRKTLSHQELVAQLESRLGEGALQTQARAIAYRRS